MILTDHSLPAKVLEAVKGLTTATVSRSRTWRQAPVTRTGQWLSFASTS